MGENDSLSFHASTVWDTDCTVVENIQNTRQDPFLQTLRRSSITSPPLHQSVSSEGIPKFIELTSKPCSTEHTHRALHNPLCIHLCTSSSVQWNIKCSMFWEELFEIARDRSCELQMPTLSLRHGPGFLSVLLHYSSARSSGWPVQIHRPNKIKRVFTFSVWQNRAVKCGHILAGTQHNSKKIQIK